MRSHLLRSTPISQHQWMSAPQHRSQRAHIRPQLKFERGNPRRTDSTKRQLEALKNTLRILADISVLTIVIFCTLRTHSQSMRHFLRLVPRLAASLRGANNGKCKTRIQESGRNRAEERCQLQAAVQHGQGCASVLLHHPLFRRVSTHPHRTIHTYRLPSMRLREESW